MRLSSTRILILAFLASLPAHSQGQWTVTSNTQHPNTAPGLECRHIVVQQPSTERKVTLETVVFDSRQHSIIVVDRPANGPNLQEAMLQHECVAGSNGGYFTPEFQPLGLEVVDGNTVQPLGSGRLLTGILVSTKRAPLLLRREEYRPGKNTIHALQSGPFLVDKAKPVIGLNASRTAARTVVATDGKTSWALVSLTFPTLAETGEILSQPDIIPHLPISRALNLDGGGSAALWISASPQPIYLRELTGVRNYVGIQPKH